MSRCECVTLRPKLFNVLGLIPVEKVLTSQVSHPLGAVSR